MESEVLLDRFSEALYALSSISCCVDFRSMRRWYTSLYVRFSLVWRLSMMLSIDDGSECKRKAAFASRDSITSLKMYGSLSVSSDLAIEQWYCSLFQLVSKRLIWSATVSDDVS